MANNDSVYSKLPQDVIFQILIKLPIQDLLQLRCVSKSFNSLVSHPQFLKLHLSSTPTAPHHLIYYEYADYTKSFFSFHADKTFSLSKILKNPFKSINDRCLGLVGSIKGVVCLFDSNYLNSDVGSLILWNTFIGKFVKILPCVQGFDSFGSNLSHVAVGFGFDHMTVDFKVVMILYDCDNGHEFLAKAFVYGVKIGSWRSIQLPVPCFIPKNSSGSVFVNGVVHWLACKKPGFNVNVQPDCIMGFDVVDEVFKLMELPQNLRPNYKEFRLSHLVDKKSVVLFVSYPNDMDQIWHLWVMNEYGKVESWKDRYMVRLDEGLFPLKIVHSGGVLFPQKDDKLIWIDSENQKVRNFEVHGLPLPFSASDYMASLALLDIGEQLVGVECLTTNAFEKSKDEAVVLSRFS